MSLTLDTDRINPYTGYAYLSGQRHRRGLRGLANKTGGVE